MSSPANATNSTVSSTTKEVFKQELSHAHPTVTIPVKKDEPKSLQAKQLADITNTFKERAANANSPPHLRSRAAAAGISMREDTAPMAVTPAPKTEEATVNEKKVDDVKTETPKKATTIDAVAHKPVPDKHISTNGEDKASDAPKDQEPIKAVQVEPISQPDLPSQTTNAEKVSQIIQAPKIKTEAEGLKETATPNGTSDANGAAERKARLAEQMQILVKDSKTDTNTEIFRMLESVEKTVNVINARIQRLEADNFDMQKQLVGLVEERERRQFLGTDSAKMPFGMEVNARTYEVILAKAAVD